MQVNSTKKLVVLKLDGDLEKGVQVSIEIGEDGELPDIEDTGWLPAAITVRAAHKKWQDAYHCWSKFSSRITPELIKYDGSLNELHSECYECAANLRSDINQWLSSEGFSPIRESWREELKSDDSIRVLIRTRNESLQKIPWHLWNFIEDSPNAEVGFSTIEFKRNGVNKVISSQKQVRILAILGDSSGINIEMDRQVLERLPGAETLFLPEPTRNELDDSLWSQPWDMLYFAGHSNTEGGTGRIYINRTESLTIEQLRNGLKKAVKNGLQIAIFNSCDGLGLAQELQQLNIPEVIVMREPVPDVVAQEFLKHFLRNFSSGQPLYASIREGRERLQKLESEYPCATWLPVIYQNPGVQPVTWQELRGQVNRRKATVGRNRRILFSSLSLNFRAVVILSAVTTSVVMGIRHFGILQTWELECFDHLQRFRPLISQEELPDSRILIIGVTEEDLKLPEQKYRQGSLSDQALSLVLQKLERAKARTIGLDIYRDFSVNKNQKQLAEIIKNKDNFFAVCKASDKFLNNPGIAPPPELPKERQGFSDIVTDRNDVLRRYLLVMKSSSLSPCTTPYALSAELAFHYLAQENYSFPRNKKGEFEFGSLVLQRLYSHIGAYQGADIWGYQSLLNYRSAQGSPLNLALQVSLKQMLDGEVKDEDIYDRIVLIGVTTANLHDYIYTPYSDGETAKKMPGVVAQGQMVSQLISAAKDNRPLLWFWNWWSEALWVFGWSLAGGILAMRLRSPLWFGLAILVSGGCLYWACLQLLVVNGSLVPLVPSALALAVGSGSVIVLSRSSRNLARRD